MFPAAAGAPIRLAIVGVAAHPQPFLIEALVAPLVHFDWRANGVVDFNLLRLGVTSANPWISTVVLNCGVLRVPVVHLLTRIDSQIRDLTCLWSPRGLAYRTADPPPCSRGNLGARLCNCTWPVLTARACLSAVLLGRFSSFPPLALALALAVAPPSLLLLLYGSRASTVGRVHTLGSFS